MADPPPTVVVLTPEQLRAFVDEVRLAVREEIQRERDDREVTLAEAAELLGVTERTVRSWAKAGKLPHRRVGREYRFRVADLKRPGE